MSESARARDESGSKFVSTRARGVRRGGEGREGCAIGDAPASPEGGPTAEAHPSASSPSSRRSIGSASTQRLAGSPKSEGAISLASGISAGSSSAPAEARKSFLSHRVVAPIRSRRHSPRRPRASRRAVSNGRVSFRLATERRFLEARSNPRTSVRPSNRVLEASRNPVLARRARWERRLRVRHGGPGDDGPGPPRFHAELGQPRRTCRGSTSGASTPPPTASVSLPSPRAFSLLPPPRRPSLTESASLPTAAHRRARRRATG